jgi:carbon monoxide dehydrogenase subunit G
MKLSGSHTFNAPREQVWATLIDIEALRTLIPGVESLEEVEPNVYKGVAKIGVAGIKGEYTGTVRLTNIDPPNGYRLTGDGRGKPGHVKGEGTLELTEEAPNQTLLRYAGDVQVGGMIASVGQRLIEGAAKLLINQGMKALAQRVEQQG